MFLHWVSNLAALISLGYAFTAGMVAAVNPCGFAMLPAYLGLFLGSRATIGGASPGDAVSAVATAPWAMAQQVSRATLVALVVTAGFVVLFGVAGIVISAGARVIVQWMPWVALGIGVVLVVLGLAMLRGRHLSANFAVRLADRLGELGSVSVRGFFVFGVAYAAASLSCTLPIFLTVVGSSLVASGFAPAAFQFVSYALGMGLIMLIFTLGIAVFKGAAVGGLRSVLPYMERVSALLLIVAGSYIVYYWLFKGGLINTFF